jgi:hypothetical protein
MAQIAGHVYFFLCMGFKLSRILGGAIRTVYLLTSKRIISPT